MVFNRWVALHLNQRNMENLFNIIEIKNVISFSAGAVLGYLIKTFIDHFLSKKRMTVDRRLSEFNAAARAFQEAFIPAIRALEEDGNDRFILNEFIESHDEARRRFEPYLKGADLVDFQQAWRRYEHYCKERINVSIYELIGSEALDPNKMQDPNHYKEVAEFRKQEALELINALLKFAKRK